MKRFLLSCLTVLILSGVATSQSVYISGRNTDSYEHSYATGDSATTDTSIVLRFKEFWDDVWLFHTTDTAATSVIPTMTAYLMVSNSEGHSEWAVLDTTLSNPVLIDSMNLPGTIYFKDVSDIGIPAGTKYIRILTLFEDVPDSNAIYTGQYSIYAR